MFFHRRLYQCHFQQKYSRNSILSRVCTLRVVHVDRILESSWLLLSSWHKVPPFVRVGAYLLQKTHLAEYGMAATEVRF